MKSNNKILINNLIPFFFLFCLVSLIYWPVLTKMFQYLQSNDDYSYGLLIPLVSIYIIYQKWPKIKGAHWQPSWWGLPVMLTGLWFFIMGELAADLYVPRVSFIMTLGGIVLLLGGWIILRLLIFPLLLLILMIPLPELVTNKLTMPLQLISSQLATLFLQFLGIPVFRQGNIIDLGVRQMQIVDACSGLRYILALLALGIIFCYFYQRKVWKIIVLLLVLIPATIFANALRVAGMGIYPALLEGFWHAFSGWLIFVFCFGILALVNFGLNRLSPPSQDTILVPTSKPEREPLGSGKSQAPWLHVVAGLFLILVFIPVSQRASQAPAYPLKQGFNNFPMIIDSWEGRHVYIDPEMVAATQSHAHLNAEFTSPTNGLVAVWIAYYETQKKAGGFVHSPKGCFTASGWQIEKTQIIEISEGKPVNWMVVTRPGEKLLVYYWFMQRGRWLSDETMNKLYMAYDGFTRRRTDGALIRLITPVGKNVDEAQQRLTLFAQDLSLILNEFIPD